MPRAPSGPAMDCRRPLHQASEPSGVPPSIRPYLAHSLHHAQLKGRERLNKWTRCQTRTTDMREMLRERSRPICCDPASMSIMADYGMHEHPAAELAVRSISDSASAFLLGFPSRGSAGSPRDERVTL